jgi:hypothetical protein
MAQSDANGMDRSVSQWVGRGGSRQSKSRGGMFALPADWVGTRGSDMRDRITDRCQHLSRNGLTHGPDPMKRGSS